MSNLYLASILFLATHIIPAYAPLRSSLVARLGSPAYFSLYTLLSSGVMIWLALTYNNAPYLEFWEQTDVHRWITIFLMSCCCLLIFIGFSTPNPYSLGRGQKGFDPSTPGIVAITRHPVILALAIWAFAHVIANGDHASMVLFGLLLVQALAGPAIMDHKRKRSLGVERWQQLRDETGNTTFYTALRQIRPWQWGGGLVLYLVLLFLHAPVIGVSPLPD